MQCDILGPVYLTPLHFLMKGILKKIFHRNIEVGQLQFPARKKNI